MCVYNRVYYSSMVVFVCLHITLPKHYHYAEVPESIELKECAHFVACVFKIKPILPIIFHAIYGAVCIQLTHFSRDDCENTCTLSYNHNKIGIMNNLSLFRVRSCNLCALYVFLCSYQKALRKSDMLSTVWNVLSTKSLWRSCVVTTIWVTQLPWIHAGTMSWLCGCRCNLWFDNRWCVLAAYLWHRWETRFCNLSHGTSILLVNRHYPLFHPFR